MMEKKPRLIMLKILIVVSFVFMLAVNILANALPINKVTSLAVAGAYPNLFVPAPVTFLIWVVIYGLLFLFVLYALGIFRGSNPQLLKSIGALFVISNIFNAGWIFAWHYHVIWLAMVLVTGIFLCLGAISGRIAKVMPATKEKWLVRLPFSIYFGCILITLIGNIIVLLVSLGLNGLNTAASIWVIVILAALAAIGLITIIRNKDAAYGLVFIWAYTGILVKHLSADGFAGQYLGVIIAVSVAIALMVPAFMYALFSKKRAQGTEEDDYMYQ